MSAASPGASRFHAVHHDGLDKEKRPDQDVNVAGGYLPPLTREETHVLSAAMYNFLSATRRLVEQPLRSMEVNQSEIEVLYFVHNHPGVGVSDIARMRFLRVSNVSTTVRALIANGLLNRTSNPDDKRAQMLQVTDKGTRVLDDIAEGWAALINKITDEMNPDSVRILHEASERLNETAFATEHVIDVMQSQSEPTANQ
ncbi:winged helix-turn-helix transcriptional regulator [Corynebacterium kroppenstedtii]|nr:winged helix-turn-helix transcriptional regulator [Corynebacterium kroppenstedtii]